MQTKIENLLAQYGHNYTPSAIKTILDTWECNKKEIICAMEKHPLYAKGEHCIVLDVKANRPISAEKIRYFAKWLFSHALEAASNAPERAKNNNVPEEFTSPSIFTNSVYDFFYFMREYTERTVNADFIRLASLISDEIHLHEGEKTTRAVNRILKYLGYDKLENYNKAFAAYADAISPTEIWEKTVISVNPLDYLTMSFGNSWASCHTIDKTNVRNMPNSYHGQFCSGTISYMLDTSSIVVYTIDKTYNGTDFWAQPKITRQMFHYCGGTLVQGRLYPQGNDGFGGEYTKYRQIVQEAIAMIFDLPNLWGVKKGIANIDGYVVSKGTHYKDYERFDDCTVSFNKNIPALSTVEIGHDPICIVCGVEHDLEEHLSCCNAEACARCGRFLETENIYWVNGDVYCEECVGYCSCCCECFAPEDVTYVGTTGAYYCQDCLETNFTICDDCNRYVEDSDIIEVDDGERYVCEDCANTSSRYCSCRRCFETFTRGRLNAEDLCLDCAEDEEE